MKTHDVSNTPPEPRTSLEMFQCPRWRRFLTNACHIPAIRVFGPAYFAASVLGSQRCPQRAFFFVAFFAVLAVLGAGREGNAAVSIL